MVSFFYLKIFFFDTFICTCNVFWLLFPQPSLISFSLLLAPIIPYGFSPMLINFCSMTCRVQLGLSVWSWVWSSPFQLDVLTSSYATRNYSSLSAGIHWSLINLELLVLVVVKPSEPCPHSQLIVRKAWLCGPSGIYTTELRSSRKAAIALNLRAISPVS